MEFRDSVDNKMAAYIFCEFLFWKSNPWSYKHDKALISLFDSLMEFIYSLILYINSEIGSVKIKETFDGIIASLFVGQHVWSALHKMTF